MLSPLPEGAEQVSALPVIDVEKDGVVAYTDHGAVLYSRLYRNLVDVVDNGAQLFVKPEEVMRNMKLVEAVFESAQTGRSLCVDL